MTMRSGDQAPGQRDPALEQPMIDRLAHIVRVVGDRITDGKAAAVAIRGAAAELLAGNEVPLIDAPQADYVYGVDGQSVVLGRQDTVHQGETPAQAHVRLQQSQQGEQGNN